MITDLVVENYQAVKDARLRLGRFTVVTGPTGSGKSAVIRALKMVVRNQRGTSFIRAGAKSCQAAIGFEDEQVVVQLRRGKGVDAYRIVVPGDTAPQVQEFTKLAGGVPEEVSAILRLSDVNFAGQLDPLFLLTSSGGDVARRLGELTNVTLLLDAAREANRRRLEVSGELKREQARLALVREQITRFADLKAQREAMAVADEHLALVKGLEHRRDSLNLRRAVVALAGEQLSAAREATNAVPSVGKLVDLQAWRQRLLARLAALESVTGYVTLAADQAILAATAEAQAHAELHEVLVTAGQCPTCGQKVTVLGQLGVKLYGA